MNKTVGYLNNKLKSRFSFILRFNTNYTYGQRLRYLCRTDLFGVYVDLRRHQKELPLFLVLIPVL